MQKHINITIESDKIEDTGTSYWIKDLQLYISDAIIDGGQKLLKQKYNHISGLRPSILGEVLGYDIQKTAFVQVLHVGANHWICISSTGNPLTTINIFDSLPNTDIPARAKCQIAALLCTEEDTITLEFHDVQQQVGARDCGLFALAFATIDLPWAKSSGMCLYTKFITITFSEMFTRKQYDTISLSKEEAKKNANT